MLFKITSLRQRLIIFLVLPVAVFLLAMGAVGYLYIRASLFKEWQEAAILRLERAAHSMDMRLSEPIQWMENFAKTGSGQQGRGPPEMDLAAVAATPGGQPGDPDLGDGAGERTGSMKAAPGPPRPLRWLGCLPPNIFTPPARGWWASNLSFWMKPVGPWGSSPSWSNLTTSWKTSSPRAGCRPTWPAW